MKYRDVIKEKNAIILVAKRALMQAEDEGVIVAVAVDSLHKPAAAEYLVKKKEGEKFNVATKFPNSDVCILVSGYVEYTDHEEMELLVTEITNNIAINVPDVVVEI